MVWISAVLLQAACINLADAIHWIPEIRRKAVSTTYDTCTSTVDWIPILVRWAFFGLRADASANMVVPQKSSFTLLDSNAFTYAFVRIPNLALWTVLVETHAIAQIVVPVEVRLAFLWNAFATACI